MRQLTTVLLVLGCFSCAGCNINSLLGLGGGKKSVTVVVDPKTQSVVVATTQQFTATVTGSSNTAVAWSVGGTSCSTQDCGSISAAGLYTAPKTIPNPALVAVTATANANSADFGAAAVTIIAAPAPASAMLRGTYTFLLSGSDVEASAAFRSRWFWPTPQRRAPSLPQRIPLLRSSLRRRHRFHRRQQWHLRRRHFPRLHLHVLSRSKQYLQTRSSRLPQPPRLWHPPTQLHLSRQLTRTHEMRLPLRSNYPRNNTRKDNLKGECDDEKIGDTLQLARC